MLVKSRRGKRVWKCGVAPGPLFFRIFQRLKAWRPARVELFEKLQGVGQISEFIHEINLCEKGMSEVAKFRPVLQPRGEFLAAGGRDLVNDASGAALGSSAARAQQPLLLEPFQAGIDLAEFGGPEMADAVVQNGFQIVAAGGRAEQAQQDMFETHARSYITYYINVNCFWRRPATQASPSAFGVPSSNPLQSLTMTCPNCGKEMTDWTLEGRLGTQVPIDVCTGCQSFWFDEHKSLQLSPGSTLKLMKYIGEHSSTSKPSLSDALRCPRCGGQLSMAHDMVRTMRFNYWGCASGHGRFIGFFDFLKEKNFIHALSPQEIQELKQNVQSVNCCSCGASIDLRTNSVCPYCHSAISMLDMKEQQQMLAQLKEAAEPKPVDPMLPLKLAQATAQTSALFKPDDNEWWDDARSADLVVAGLKLVARWITTDL